ncbi:hypothetical protein Tco_1284265 [Tanacetum coccineum]
MPTTAAQQVSLDNALEPTYQVILDALALTTCYPAFLIIADVPEIYMHQFGHTITKIKKSSSYKFKLDKKKRTIDVEVFHDILQICLRLLNQEFDALPSNEEIRTFASIINKCLSGKITGLDNQTLKSTDTMSILGTLRFVSKSDEYQVYGALLPKRMTNQQMQDSHAYKTYLAFATGATTPKKARKFKKPASHSKKKALVVEEEHAEKPKKAPAKDERSKRIKLLSQAASLDEAHNDERTESDDDKSVDLNKTDDEEEVKFVHTPDDYVPTDDENVDDEEYERINKEMYNDVNVELKDTELEGEWKDDEEMTDVVYVDAERQNVNQEVASDQDKDVARTIVIAAPTTQKTKVPLQCSSISSDYATKFLNFDNIPSTDTKIISMMDIKVQHKDPSIQTSPLLTVTVTVILETSSAPATTIPLPIPPFITLPQQSKLIPTPTTTEATTSTTTAADSTTLTSEVPIIVKEYLGTSLDDALHKSILEDEDAMDKGVTDKLKKRKPDDTDRDEGPPVGPNQGLKRKKTGKETELSKKARPPTPDPEWNEGKTFDKKPTQKWLSDLAKVETSSKTIDDLMNTLIDISTFVMNRLQINDLTQDILNNPKGDRYPFDLSKPLPLVKSGNHQIILVDYFFNNDMSYLQGGSTNRTYKTSLTKIKATKYDLPRIEDMVPNLWSPIKVAFEKHALLVNIWYGYGHLEEIEVRRSDQQLYKFKEGDFTRLYLNDIEDMLLLVVQNRLFNLKGQNIMHLATALRPQGVIYEDKLNRKRLMCSDELYKFSDGTLQSVRDTLHDMATNLRMRYNKAMPKRRWSHLDKTRSHIMVKEIDRQLRERRLMRQLEKFVGGRHYGEDLRLLQQTI